MWRELIQTLAQDSENTYEFAPAATYFQLERIEQLFNVKLPATLRQLLLETNGVRQVMFYNDERVPVGQIIWDTESVQRQNRKMRTDPAYQDFYLSFDTLFFFGSPNTDSVRFALSIHETQVTEIIVAWYATDDRRVQVATSLQTFIEDWLSGRMTF